MFVIIRTIWAWVAGFFILLTLSIISFLVGLIDHSGDSSHIVAGWWGKGIVWVSGIRVHVSGLENIKRTIPYIFVANHQSFYDIFILSACLPVQFRYIVKKELFKIPFIGMAMRAAKYISIDRDKAAYAMESLREAIGRIKQGKSVVIFPEGTRTEDGKINNFKRGSLLLASKTKVPVVPVSLCGTFNIMPKGSFTIHPTDVYLRFHEPIETEKLDRNDQRELGEKIRTIIASELVREKIS